MHKYGWHVKHMGYNKVTMLVLSNRILNVPLMSLQTGMQIGATHQAIIDPRRLIVVAFYCEGPRISFRPAVVHTSDIREFSSVGMIIDSADSIMPLDDLVRLQEIVDFNFELIGKPVVEEDGQKLGSVVDFTIDTTSFAIAKLHVKQAIWRSFGFSELLIDRSQVKSITDKKIIVKRADMPNGEIAEGQRRQLITNPFRKPKAQAQTIDSMQN